MDNFDDFDTQIQSDELIPSWFEDDDDSRGLTADERDERGLHDQFRNECFEECEADDEDELCAVFGADDPDNYYGDDAEDEQGEDDEW